jgi:hypothetical protein
MRSLPVGLAFAFVAYASAAGLKSSITLHASFDTTERADFARGDAQLYHAADMKGALAPGLPSRELIDFTRSAKFGAALQFKKKTPEIICFKADHNIAYNTTNFSGTVSFWLSLTPDGDLAPGYTDPLQITSKQWDDAAFFIEFTKDDKPRHLRLGAYADTKVWNPTGRNWNDIPFEEKPLIKVEHPPFKRTDWTHIVFTFSNYNTGKANGETALYLNGKSMGSLSSRKQTFTWSIADARIYLGLSYTGLFDELTIFDRALTAAEVQRLHQLPGGVKSLLK